MNLPNSLTIARIFLVPFVVVILLTTQIRNWEFWGVTVFLGAAVTDLLDGYLARRRKQVTTLGRLLDPIADKLLISSALVSLVQLGIVPAWMVAIIIGREFAVSGLRNIAATEGFTIEASRLGKGKMALQVAAVAGLILGRVRGGWVLQTARERRQMILAELRELRRLHRLERLKRKAADSGTPSVGSVQRPG